MSIQLMSIVWGLSLVTTDKFVLLSLADQANDAGHCWPSIPTISKRCGLTERSVYNVISRLTERGFLHKKSRPGTSTQYIVTPEAGSPRPCKSFTPESSSPLQEVHPSPEPDSGEPLKEIHPTPEGDSPKPSLNHQLNHQGTGAPASFDKKSLEEKIQKVVEGWNELAGKVGLHKILNLPPRRTENIEERLGDCGGVNGFTEAFVQIENSAYLRGEVKEWRIDFDWLLKRGNFQKVIEGVYQDRNHANMAKAMPAAPLNMPESILSRLRKGGISENQIRMHFSSARFEREGKRIVVKTAFQRDWIQNNFESQLAVAFGERPEIIVTV